MIRIPGPQPAAGLSVWFLGQTPPGRPVESSGGLAVAATAGAVSDGWARDQLDPHVQPLGSEADILPDLADQEAALVAQGNRAATNTEEAGSLVQAQGAVTTPDVDGQLGAAAAGLGRGIPGTGGGSSGDPGGGDTDPYGNDRQSNY